MQATWEENGTWQVLSSLLTHMAWRSGGACSPEMKHTPQNNRTTLETGMMPGFAFFFLSSSAAVACHASVRGHQQQNVCLPSPRLHCTLPSPAHPSLPFLFFHFSGLKSLQQGPSSLVMPFSALFSLITVTGPSAVAGVCGEKRFASAFCSFFLPSGCHLGQE